MQLLIFLLDDIGGSEMPKFCKNKIKGLKELLYNSYAHDAQLKKVEYACEKECIKFELFNPIFNVRIDITFYNISVAFAIKGKEYGSRETINSLTVEEDFSYLQNYIPNCDECIEDSIYLLFQMFSGDEFHIVSKEVFVEILSNE